MAHYAFLNENNVVTEVIVGNDESNFFDWEQYYAIKRGTFCKRTSYNTKGGVYYNPITNLPDNNQTKAFRKNYASVGFTYDYKRDAFIPPQPYPSWILNENTCIYEPPVSCPTDGKTYIWNEQSQSWNLFL